VPRKNRGDLIGKYFHVLVEGIDKDSVFQDETCKKYYLELLREASRQFHLLKLLAFSIMENHVHALLVANDISAMSEFFKSINSKYANWYNLRHKRIGPVFRGRYKSENLGNGKFIGLCMAFIHNNPLKAGIERAEDWPFSSYKIYCTGLEDIVSFGEAKKYCGISKSELDLAMKNAEHASFIEHNERIYQDENVFLLDFIRKHGITFENRKTLKGNPELLNEIVLGLKSECGLTFSAIARLLDINKTLIWRLFCEKK
jgi:REP element-mobilizing transposase RayT